MFVCKVDGKEVVDEPRPPAALLGAASGAAAGGPFRLSAPAAAAPRAPLSSMQAKVRHVRRHVLATVAELVRARRRLLLALRAALRRLVRSSTPRSRLAVPARLGLPRRARRASRLAVLPSPSQLLRRPRLLLLWLPSPCLCPSRSRCRRSASPFRLRLPPARRLPARCVHAQLRELCAGCDADGCLRRRRIRQLRRKPSSSARRRHQARPPWCRWLRRRARRQRSPRPTTRPLIPRRAAVLLPRAAAAGRPRPSRL